MNWNFLITFGIGLCLYLVFLFIFGAIKRHKNKKHLEKEKQEHEKQEEKQD